MSNVIEEVQKEVARIRDMITTTKALLPNGRGNFVVYDTVIALAEKAIREQDTVTLVAMLPELRNC